VYILINNSVFISNLLLTFRCYIATLYQSYIMMIGVSIYAWIYIYKYYTQDNMISNYVRNFVNYFHQLTHIYQFAFFRPRCKLSDFFHSRTEGPNSFCNAIACRLRTNISVKAVVHCMLVKHADIYIHTWITEHIGVSSCKTGHYKLFILSNVCCSSLL
jgi:hypothetical protein